MVRTTLLRTVLFTVVGTVAIASCGHRAGKPKRSEAGQQARPKPARNLPPPLELPREPLAAAHTTAPAQLLHALDPYVDTSLDPTLLLRRELGRVTSDDVAAVLASSIDASQPWTAARLDPQNELAYLPVRPTARAELSRRLQSLPREGTFGAVRLPSAASPNNPKAPQTGPGYLAWFDDQTGYLTLARTLRGVVTGSKLREHYGTSDVMVSVAPSQIPPEVPVAGLRAAGKLDDLGVTAAFRPGTDLFADYQLRPGALTGLLADPKTVAGVSTRWAGSDTFVRDTIAQIRREVGKQSFLIKGVLEDLAGKFYAVLRSWDGRSLVALSGPGHLRLAYGSADVEGSRKAALRFLRQLADNVALLRNFTSDVPSIRLAQNAGDVGGSTIHALTLSGAHRHLPAELRPLLDEKNRLRIAMSWSSRAGAGLFVVGPNAVDELEDWLKASKEAPTGNDTATDVLAVVFAADPAEVATLATSTSPSAAKLFELAATGLRHQVVARRQGNAAASLRLTRGQAALRTASRSRARGQL